MIVITGASDGLGAELARHYKKAGYHVVNLSRTPSEEVDETIQMDLTDPSSIKNAAKQLIEREEPLEVLINCAGVMSLEPVTKISEDEIERVFRTNIMGAIQLTSLLIDKIRADHGDILNVASTVGLKAYKDQAAYGASKWAMRGFSQNLQVEMKDDDVRVISFCVGGFNSDIAKKVTGQDIPDPENWMNPADIAVFAKQLLDLPRSMEVTEIVITRKALN